MTDSSAPFPVSARNRVKRVHERGSYDRGTVFAILDAAMLCHVSYVIDGQPYCTPTIHWREGDTLYWHGSSASRMLRHLRRGMPACLTVAHLDGLVLARSAFHHSANYRSAMCFGTARPVEGTEAKLRAMRGLVDRFFPGRHDTLRPVHPQEVKASTFIAMPIEEASAKVRAKGVSEDEEDYAFPAWAGVIPVRTAVLDAVPCPRMAPGIPRPEGLAPFAPGRPLGEALLETRRIHEGLRAPEGRGDG